MQWLNAGSPLNWQTEPALFILTAKPEGVREMKIKKGLKVSSSDFWYDLTDGGYLNPEEICAIPKDAKNVLEAIKILKDFQESCEEQIDDFIQ